MAVCDDEVCEVYCRAGRVELRKKSGTGAKGISKVTFKGRIQSVESSNGMDRGSSEGKRWVKRVDISQKSW